jgi:hypothetical protein
MYILTHLDNAAAMTDLRLIVSAVWTTEEAVEEITYAEVHI